MKYLLVMHCDEDGYWDTSGYCHWKKDEFFNESEFELDDKEGLLRAIANFKFEYPNGDLYLYKIEEMSWDDSNNIIQEADPIIKDLKMKANIAEKEKKKKEQEASAQRQKANDLEQLRKLQEKYKGEI